MTNYREILRLHNLGISNAQVAVSCGCSRTTVVSTLKKAREQSLTWPQAAGMSNEEIAAVLFPLRSDRPVYRMPDYEYVYKELQRDGVTLNLLWLEYCDQCRNSGQLAYKSTQFNKLYGDYVHKTKLTMHIEHKPGEKMEVDWAGNTARIISTDTGEPIKAYLFVAVLPHSEYAYAEAFLDMKQEAWITGHVNAYRYFGGVTRILIPDNLKTGVIKNTKAEVQLNRTYQEMAEHYGTAIIPARPRTPKDKASVEGTVGILSTFILAALRDQQFFTLKELNHAIRRRLDEFNCKPFQKREGSRATAYEMEKLFLLPLPTHPYELAVWKKAVIQYNYHISVDKQNYSVPFEYIKQTADVRLTQNTVEVFLNGNRIASHTRLHGRPNQYSTLEEHMPPEHQRYLYWNADRFREKAERIGPNTCTIVKHMLASRSVEQQAYKSCMALLKLTEKYAPSRLEAACKKALSYTAAPNYKMVQSILKSDQDLLVQESRPAEQYGFTRGASYYEVEEDAETC